MFSAFGMELHREREIAAYVIASLAAYAPAVNRAIRENKVTGRARLDVDHEGGIPDLDDRFPGATHAVVDPSANTLNAVPSQRRESCCSKDKIGLFLCTLERLDHTLSRRGIHNLAAPDAG